jgi:hypothetical protein
VRQARRTRRSTSSMSSGAFTQNHIEPTSPGYIVAKIIATSVKWVTSRDPVKSQFRQIEFINKDVDHLNGSLRKQRALPAIRALNEALHPIPRSSQESALRESHEAGRFHTARVRLGHSALSARCPVCPKADTAGRFMSTHPSH